jgi:hypothetical protein
MGDEDGHHVVVLCTKAKALRSEMRKHWLLPDEAQFRYTGPDWLILLLDSVDKETRAQILFLLWRAWYLRNDIIHGKGTTSIVGSGKFLTSYMESLGIASQGLSDVAGNAQTTTEHWWPPPLGWVKVNSDATFYKNTGAASTGVVIRDAAGKVLLSAWRVLHGCASSEHAEAEACLHGLRLSMEWIQELTWVESDCSTLINDIVNKKDTRSM